MHFNLNERMVLVMFLFLFLEVSGLPLQHAEVFTRPEQIHLSLTDTVTEMMVTWVTMNATGAPVVQYGLAMNKNKQHAQWPTFDHVAVGVTDKFIDGGKLHHTLYIHRVKMTGLKANQQYVYHVGGAMGWSDVYFFKTYPLGTSWSPRIALFGDMGNENAKSLARLQQETQQGFYDAIFHVGDFAYNLDTDNARVGDEFMNQIQAIAAYVPYMTSVGNHEDAYNFSNYKSRFTMPGGDGQSMYFSFDIGPAHVLSFSSEFYYYVQYGFQQIINQYRWMEKDLQEASLPENRAKRPWIITMCHRPMYCSNSNDPEHCASMENLIRTGVNHKHDFSPEELLYKYGVDLHIQAHEHSYERMWPVYNLTVCNGSVSEPYRNPRAPVHIVTGSAGCNELVDPFFKTKPDWSAFHSDDYGYTRLQIINSTHLYLEQVSDDKGGIVIDKMTLIKEHHGSYDCHLGVA